MRYIVLISLLLSTALLISCQPQAATPIPEVSNHMIVAAKDGTPIHFPRQKPVEGERDQMAAAMIGELILSDGCLIVKSTHSPDSILVYYSLIWPPDFVLSIDDDGIGVRDGNGQLLARLGDEIVVGGGTPPASAIGHFVDQPVPTVCPSPYWIVGNFGNTLTVYVFDDTSIVFPRFVDDTYLAGEPATFTGRLLPGEGCLVLEDSSSGNDFALVWPPDYSLQQYEDTIQVVDGQGKAVAQIGEEILLHGGESRIGSLLVNDLLLGRCPEPFWTVVDVLDP